MVVQNRKQKNDRTKNGSRNAAEEQANLSILPDREGAADKHLLQREPAEKSGSIATSDFSLRFN